MIYVGGVGGGGGGGERSGRWIHQAKTLRNDIPSSVMSN